ncbi:relaxase domain-containing protein [Acidithiobacillus ferrooxidans]|uniref:MobF family relaxase n=1 Tax=Acidithiobacillus ferrooxidans TaxID=920 RepID=UPI0021483D0D|nr:MobF family relaxase [Acidithiobacillus ferrooxidans]MCR1347130.1 relaxase domain-containing protein [Acidithiobacillus ferrooxidans]MCR1356680.1 relaxase domain-containing protein [Acidithiobacillus ferrooxidans]
MIRVKPIKSRGGAAGVANYLRNAHAGEAAEQAVGYYSERGGAPSYWAGRGAEALGLSGAVDNDQFQALLEGKLPDGTDLAGRHQNRRMGDGYVLSAPKSVSMMACEDERWKVWHDEGVKAALAFLQKHMVYARLGKGGRLSEYDGDIIAAVHRHEDARPVDGIVDMDLHSHVTVINSMRRSDGQWTSINNDQGVDCELQKEADAIYLATMARLAVEHGYELEQSATGFEVAGITRDQIEIFSRRRGQIQADLSDKGGIEAASVAQRDAAWSATRAEKRQLSQSEQRWEWLQRLREAKVPTRDLLVKSLERARQREMLPPDRATLAVKGALEHCSEHDTVFSRSAVRAEALRQGMAEGLSIETIDAALHSAPELLDGGVVDRDGTGKVRRMHTTTRAVEEELAIQTIATQGEAEALQSPEAVSRLLAQRQQAQGWNYSNGQIEAIQMALTGKEQHQGIVGAAGAGKTTSMAVIVEQYRQAGYEVIGLAPSAKAAAELQSAGCETLTLESFLRSKPTEASRKVLYIVDEAGMVSRRDLLRFYRRAQQDQARTLAVGDPRQLQAVQAGNPFEQLLRCNGFRQASITQINRQKDKSLLVIAEAFASGDAEEGLRLADPYLREISLPTVPGHKKLDKAAKQEVLAKTAAVSYLRLSPEERRQTLVLAASNATRRIANTEIRRGLIERRELGQESVQITALDKVSLSVTHQGQAAFYRPGQVVELGRAESGVGERGTRWKIVGTENGKLQVVPLQAEAKVPVNLKPSTKLQLYDARPMELREGDQVLFRQNDKSRDLDLRNGDDAVIAIQNGKAFATLRDGKSIELKTSEVMDYGYCRTVHASQGATVDRAIVIAESSRAGANLGYVALSREKHYLEVLTDDKERLVESWGKYVQQESAREAAMRGTLQTARDQAREVIAHQMAHARAKEKARYKTQKREQARNAPTASKQRSPAYDPGIGW